MKFNKHYFNINLMEKLSSTFNHASIFSSRTLPGGNYSGSLMANVLKGLFLLLCLSFSHVAFGQLTGIKTIPGNYATIALAVGDLNAMGVGAGGVTFDVAAGHTEVSDIPVLTATGTEANPIIFQKSGVGNNPKITPFTAGTIAVSTTIGANGDAIFTINGGDYITIDGIDLETDATFSANGMYEYGYLLKKASGTDACKNVTIMNCAITLNKAAIYSFGIAASNISGTTSVTVTTTGGRTENLNIDNNTISNSYGGILLRGFLASSPYDLYDQNNRVGLNAGNTISDFGGGGTAAYGIYGIYQNDVYIANNVISGGDNTTSTLYGIYHSTANNSNIDVENNTVTLSSSATTSVLAGIYLNAGTVGTNNSHNVTNNTVTGLARPGVTTGVTYFIYFSSNSPSNLNISGNTVGSSSIASTGTIYGIYQFGSPANLVISGNAVSDITRTSLTSTSALYGIFSDAVSTGTGSIWGNTVHTITGNGSNGIVGGISVGTQSVLNLYSNKIYNITSNHASGLVYGVTLVTALTTANVYNNLIGDLQAPLSTSTGADAIRGISIQNLTTNGTINLSYNTIFLNASSSGANFTTTGIYHTTSTTATTSALQMRNNIIVNNSTPNGTGLAIAYRRSNATLTNYGSLSNNNLFYAGTPGANNVIFYDGSTSDETLALYKSRVTPRDASSVSENPPFLSTTGGAGDFLHINTGVATQIESGGVAVTGITDDYDSNVRFGNPGYFGGGSAPDIGADEFTGIGADLNGPTISYSLFVNTSCTNDRDLSAAITDASGVNTTAGTKPRLYFKKKTDANTYTGNTSGNNGWKYVEASNASSPFSFTTNYSLLQSAVTTGDTIQYFVVAQDLAGTPNVNINSGTFNSAPTSVALGAGNFPLTGTINSFAIVVAGLSGTVTIGVAGTYTSLTGVGGLFEVVNTMGLSGSLTVNIMDPSVTESGATALNAINYNGCAAGPYSLTIKPGAGVTAVLTGAVSPGAIIKLNGADNVTIDGSNNGTSSRDLTIQNTTTSTSGNAVIWLASPAAGNGATNNTIKNTVIEGSSSTTTFMGMFVGGNTTISLTAAGTELNSNNTIHNNLFRKTIHGLVLFGYNAAFPDNNNVISNNNFGTSISGEGFNLQAIHAERQINMVVSGNDVQNVRGTSTTTMYGIRLLDFKNGQAYNNVVHNLSYTGTSTGKVYGIALVSTSYTTFGNPSMAKVYNNLVYDLTSTSTSAVWNITGILAGLGYGDSYYYNSVHLTGQLSNTASGLSAAFANGDDNVTGFGTDLNVRNNIFNIAGVTAATSDVYAYYSRATTLAGTTQTNNVLRAAGTGGNNLTGRLNSIDYATLATWQAGSGVDANSIESDPLFNSDTDLHPQPGSPVLAAGTPIAGITTDISGAMRSVTMPTIGAYEQAIDVAPPAITYTQLSFTCLTGDRSLNGVLIEDGSSVPTAGALQARIYYKKDIAGTWFSSQGSLAAGSGISGTWNFTIVAADMGGIAPGDTVYYYVIAQDNASPINVGSNPSAGLVATNVNTVNTHPTSPNFYHIANTLSGTYMVGAGQTYTTLTSAVNAYNSSCLGGPVVFELIEASYSGSETFPIEINENVYSSMTNTLTIRPAASTAVSISGSSVGTSSALIRLNGADHVNLDGINSGGASLTIENSSTSSGSCVLWLSSNGTGQGATNNTIENTTFKGGVTPNTSTTVTYGIVMAGPTLATTVASIAAGDDNDNNTFSGNSIIKARYAFISRGGSTTNPNTGTVISDNTIGPNAFGTESIGKSGILIREEDGTQITGNEIRFVGGTFGTTSGGTDRIGITFGTDALWTPTSVYVKNAVVKNNLIHDIIEERTFSAVGIAIAAADGSNPTNNIIANNMLYNIKANGTSPDQTIGIGLHASNNDVVAFNTIYLTGDTDPDAGATTPTISNFGISISSTSVSNPSIKNNIVYMDLTSSSANTIQNACINIPASFVWGTGGSNYNDFYFPAGNTQSNTGAIGGNGGTFYLSLANWQAAATQDANSLDVEPVFVSPTDVHLVPASNLALDNFGTPVAGVTTDFDGDVRDVTNPDMGADEFTPATGLDVSVTGMVSPGLSGCFSAAETVTVTLVNNSITTIDFAINNVTVTVTATGGYNSNFVLNSGTLAGSGSIPVTMPATIDMSADGTYTFNASSSVAGDIDPGNDAMPPAIRIKESLGGTYPIGAGQSGFGGFETITAFLADYNTVGCFTGNVIGELYDATYTTPAETFPLVITDNPAAGTYTLTIRPNAATAVTITGTAGASATALVKLDGADYINIDGVNAGGASLLIQNTSVTTGSAAIWIASNGVDAGATNNTIQNVNIQGSVDQNTSTTNTYGIVMAGLSLSGTVTSVAAGNDNDNNVITNNTFIKLRHGVYTRGGSSTNLNTGTVISNNTFGPSSFGSDVLGKAAIIAREENGIQITGNEIRYIGGPYAMATSGTDRAGIVFSTLADWTTSTAIFVKNAIVANNIIHDIVEERTNSAIGITVNCDSTGGTNNAFVNNVIYNLRGNGISDFTIGIGLDEGKGDVVAYNSIYLSGDTDPDAGASTPTSGNTGILINASTFANPVLRNNVVYMDLFSSSATTLAENTCIKVPASYNWGTGFSNDNDLYINPYNAHSNIGAEGSTYYFDLNLWRIVSGEDGSSISLDPEFNSTTDLRPRPNSPLLNAGEPIPGITADILGVTRDATSPTIGAYEDAIDESGPVISYDLLTANTLCTANVNISATISDPSLVNVSAGTKPRLYFKKSTETNTYAGNTSAFNGWKYVEATNSTSPFSFTTDYSLLFSAIAPGDVIQYFVVAQDQSITPYVTVSGATLAAAPTSVALTSGAFPATGMNSYSILTGPGLSSNVTIGAVGATYTTLSGTGGLFAAINAAGLSANITATILDATLPETGAVALNHIAYDCGGPYTLTIKPGTGVTTLLSGSTTSGLITLNGADNVVIDGSNNGTSTRDMRIRNTGTGTANALRLSGNSTFNSIQNVIFEGISTTTTNGVVLFGIPGVGKEGNSNNDLINCEIRDRSDATGVPNTGIYSSGLSSGPNSSNRIMGTNIYNFSGTGINIASKGIVNAWEISDCNIYNAQATASSSTQNGILISNGSEHTISGNFVGGNAAGAVGTWANSGGITWQGISLAGGSAKITGNTVANITGTSISTAARFRGIAVTPTVAGTLVSNNMVHDILTSAARTGLGADVVAAVGIYSFPTTYFTTTISNNIVYNISIENTTALTTSNVAAGIAVSNFSGTVYGNRIYDIKNKTTGITANQPPIAAGIYARALSNANVFNNMVSLGSTESTNTQFNGIMNPTSVGGTHNYYHNSIYVSGSTAGTWGSNAYLRGDNSGTSVTPNVNLRNNIFAMERTGGTSVNYAISNPGSSASTNWSSNYNDLYNSVGANIGFWNATGYDFANWKTTSGGDVNSISVAPVFVSTTDLHLTVANTGIDNAGTPIALVPTDFDGAVRNLLTPDPGAHEIITSGCPKFITNGADSGSGSLRAAIACAQSGEQLIVDETVPLITLTSGEIVLNKTLIITGHGINDLDLSGNNNSRIFHLLAGHYLKLEDMTLMDATSVSDGGAFWAEDDMTLKNIRIINCDQNGIPKGFTSGTGSIIEFIGNSFINQ